MIRDAVIIGNTAKTSDPRNSVNLSHLRRHTTDIAHTLAHLGEYSFDVTPILEFDRDAALAAFTKAVKKTAARFDAQTTPADTSCLLVYYFGHGVERMNDLHLAFKDSNTAKLPTMIGFRQIADIVFGLGIPRAVFVIDSCYAGAAAFQVHAASGGGQRFVVLASTVALQRAAVREGPSPFGAFSLYLFGGLRDVEAAAPPAHQVTVTSLFRYVKDALDLENYEQEAYLIDGGLSEFVLAEALPKVVIDPRFNSRAAKKSFYRKMWWIGSTILERSSMSTHQLYAIVRKSQPIEFLTPVKRGSTTAYQPIQESTFGNYIERLRTLTVVGQEEPLSLTPQGRKMFAKGGVYFNRVLVELVGDELVRQGFSVEQLDSLVRYKVHSRGIPTATELFLDARRIGKPLVTSEWFGTLLELLAQCGYFRYAAQKTYFPY